MEKPVKSSLQNLSISYECALAIGNSLNLSEMLHEVIHTMVHKTNAHRGIIWVKNGEEKLQPVASAGINIEDVLAQGGIMDIRDAFNQILKRQQFVLRYKDEKDFLQYCPVLTGKEESVLIVPVNNVAILYLVYASREIADEPLANLLASLSKKLSVAIEACTAHENVIKEIQVREKAEKELTKKTEQLVSSQKELQGLYGKSEQARKSTLSILEDVTQKEEALKESKSKLNSILSSIDDLVFVFDQEDRFIFTQKTTSGQLYTTPDKFIGKKPSEVMPSHLNKIFSDAFDKIREGDVAEYDYWLMFDGKTLWFSAKHSPRFIDGEFVGSVSVVRDITERKQAEEEIITAKARLEYLLAKSSAIIYSSAVTEPFGATYISENVGAIMGFEPSDFLEYPGFWANQIHPDDYARVFKDLETIFEVGFHNYEYRWKKKDGSYVWIHDEVRLVYDEKGTLIEMVGTWLDITERKQAEEALRESEDRFRTIFDSVNDAVFIHDIETGAILDVNKTMCEMYGYSREEVDQLDIQALSSGEVPYTQQAALEWNKKAAMGEAQVFEWMAKHKSGHLFWVEISMKKAVIGLQERLLVVVRDITERKQAEETLKKSEAKFRSFFEYGLMGVAITSSEMGWIEVNDHLCELLGYTRDEMVTKTWSEMTHPEDLVHDVEQFNRLLDGEIDNYSMEKRFIRKDGKVIDSIMSVSGIRRPDGSVDYMVAFIQDITVRKKAEKARQESEERFRTIFDSVNDAVFIHDIETGAILNVNRTMCEMYGYSREEAVQLDIQALSSGEVPYTQQDALEWNKKAAMGDAQVFEWMAKHKSGHLFWVEVSMKKAVIGLQERLLVVVRDISERKQADEALWESENRYHDLFENANDLIQKVGPDGKILLVNKKWLETMEYSEEEVKSLWITDILREDRIAQTMGSLQGVAKGGTVNDFETIFITKNGKEIYVEGNGNGIFKDGKFIAAIGLFRDITERKQAIEEIRSLNEELEKRIKERTADLQSSKQALVNIVEDLNMTAEELKNANESLQELDRMKSMFIASTSHELRTPLNSIIGFTSILLEGWSGELNTEQKEQLGMVHTSGKHLLNLINDVIDISKIEAGKLDVYISEFKLKEVVDEVVSVVRNDIDEKGLTLTIEMEDITLISDRRRLLQSFLNLLSNAVKFTLIGNITIQAKSINSKINISVTDSGIGVKHEDIPKLFTPFVRLETPLTNSTAGTGLGLYLTKKLTKEALGGTVDVISEYGKGSTFILNIPIETEEQK